MNTTADFTVLSSLEALESEFNAKRNELITKLSSAGKAYYEYNLGKKTTPKATTTRKARVGTEELNSSLLAIQHAMQQHFEQTGEGITKREVAAMVPDLEFGTIDSYISVNTGKLWKIAGTKRISGQRGPESNIYLLIESKSE